MHISLDSALGRQRRLNSVGESVLQIAPNAAAAYSLRSLTGGDPKVVRVRRGSDNHEQDFTASEVSSGALTSFVNAQVTPPLDIRALTATGRDGDFLIAKAAYSLRSLGTRQATLGAIGDTVARAPGKFVAQVRRSSDDALKSFTATEVTDGTLLAFVNQIQTVGTAVNGTGSFDNYTVSNLSTTGFSADNSAGGTGSAGFPYVFKDEDVIVVKYTVTNFSSTASLSPQVRGVNAINSVTGKTNSGTAFTANGTYTDTLTATADGTHLMFADGNTGSYTISDFEIVSHSSNGFVKTWYDQSVTNQAGDTATGNHAVQATAAEQPKIVNAGALVADSGIDFDGSQFLQANSVSGMGATVSMNVASVHDSGGGGCVSLASSASGVTNFGIIEGNSVTNVNSRNTTSVTASASVSGVTRLSFALTTGQTSTKSGALGGTLVESTSDYGDDFTSGELDRIIIGKLRASSGTLFNGRVREALIYNTDQTDNRTAIEANIGEAYGIDLPSGVDPLNNEVDGFVETWYDQSGNGRDSTNTTATQQPLIVEAGVFQNGLKFTHTDTTNGKRLFVPRTQAELGGAFAFVWVGKITSSDTSYNNVLGGTRGVTNFAAGTAGISIISSTGSTAFINEESTSSRVVSASSTATTLNEDSVVFATYEEDESGPGLTFQVDAGNQFFSFGSSYNLSSSKDIGIMNSTSSGGSYRTEESPTGICREVLVYDTHQGDNRVALVDNINNQYNLF